MAAGSVVIGANAGGIPDIVKHNVNGFLYDPERPGDLARIAARVVQEPALCHEIRANARQQSEECNWAVSTRQLLRFYEEAIHMPPIEKPEDTDSRWMLALKKATVGGMRLFLS